MKKSTLFFKVMVLLALLVPWTSWGQSLIDPRLPDGATQADIIGSRSMVLKSDGSIPGENNQKGKNFSLSEFTAIGDNDLSGWSFTGTIFPEETGLKEVSFPGGDLVQIKDKIAKPTVSAIYFEVKNAAGEKKWVVYGFAPEGTPTIKDVKATYTVGGGSRYYNGEKLTEEKIKKGLTVTATIDGKSNTSIDSYTITIPDEATDAGTYSITINVTGTYVGATQTTVSYEIKKRPITIVVKEGANLEYEVGDAAPTEFKAEDYLTVADGTDKSGLVGSEIPTFTGNLTVTGFSTEKAGTFTIEKGEVDITDNESTGFKKNNYNPTWSLIDAKITVKRKTVDPDDITGTDSDGKTIVGSTESYEVTYDGKEHGVATVKIGETILDSKDYTVKYDEADTKPTNVKITDKEVAAYTVTIRLNEDKYEVKGGKPITGSIKILQRDLTVKGKDNVTIQWNGNTMVTTASTYLEFEAEDWVSGEGGTLSGDVKIEKNAEGDGYIITKGENTGITWNEGTTDTNYKVDWSALTSGISAGGSPTEGEDITLDPGAEGEENVILSNSETTKEYNGYAYSVSQVAGVDINENNATVTIVKEGADSEENIEIKDVGTYTITVDYTKEGTRYTSIRIFKITPAPLTITVAEQTVQITSMDNLNKEGLSSAEAGFTSAIKTDEGGNVTVEGLKGPDVVSFDGNSFTLAEKEWVLGENVEAINLAQDVTVTTDDSKNYDVEVKAGTLNVIFLINEENKDQFISFTNGDNERVYDGIGLTDSDVKLNIEEAEYSVAFSAKETDGDNEEYVDAGTYTVTVTITNLEELPYELAEGVNLTADYTITKRPLILYFSFEEGIEKGEELVLGENASVEVAPTNDTDNLGFANNDEKAEFDALLGTEITAEFHLGDEQANGMYEVILDSFTFPVEEVGDGDLTYDNYDVSLLVGHLDAEGTGEDQTEVDLPDSEEGDEDGDGEITYKPDGEGDDDDVVGVIDPVDPNTGIGGSGINYRQYELNFCETDFLTRLNDYDTEGLKLFSRHDKKYTKAGGSFTVWYEKDGVKNAEYGDYRIYISRNGANGNYTELKLDEVSDYFQIRNVQSDIYVRIYYGTGFPVANEEITATDVRAYAQANKIVVITPEPTDVQIISMAGAVVATDQVIGQREFANLAEGVYIVRMGETVIKLQVRN